MSGSGTNDPPESTPNDQSGTPPTQFTFPNMPIAFGPSMQVQISAHQGPLPPAQVLAAYDQAHPGAAAWILKEAEASATHVRDMERRAMRYQARDALLHRILPFLLVALLLIISAILAIFASPYLGGAAFFGTLAGVVGVYLKGAMDSGKQSAAAAPGSEVVGSSGHPPPR